MKKYCLICSLILTGFCAQAQTSFSERVIGKTTFYYNGAIYEPETVYSYYWSADRTSRQDGVNVLLENYDSMDRHPDVREIRVYDTTGNLTTSVNRNWDGSSWRDNRRFTYQYLDKKLVRATEEERRDGVMSNARRTTYTFSDSELVERLHEVWVGGYWEESRQIRYQYSSGRLTEKTEGDRKTSYGYDLSGALNIVENSIFKWGMWHPETKDSTIYRSGRVAEVITFKNIAIMAPEWTNDYRTVYDHVPSGLLSITYQSWDPVTRRWINKNRYVNAYSGSKLTDSTAQNWDGSTWENRFRFVYTYNINGHVTSQTREEWIEGSWQPTATDIEPSRIVYYYEPFLGVASVPVSDQKATLYPNPANGAFAYLDYHTTQDENGEIVLSDVRGKEILHLSERGNIGDHSVAIPVSGLSPGFYFLTLYLDGQHKRTLRFTR